ncbi:hypothetical protein [Amaricoccus macauensis]|uniref:hypothetical protein n=1 Tax=Amaricoccus macauensis TaxID=57001 RepID=UPI003C7E1B41
MKIRFHKHQPARRDSSGFSRRMFLMTTAMAGVTTGALLGSSRPLIASVLAEGQPETLLRMVQDIYPHPDLLQLSHYEAIVDMVGSAVAQDPEKAASLSDGITRIDALALELHGVSYTDIEEADAREGLLRNFQDEGFFQQVRWTAYFAIYDNKELWPLFGYEGSSVEHGGYIDRGFSDITFVPQGPSLEERLAEVRS